jgi:hypothetical protein
VKILMIVGAACHRYNSNLRDVDIVHGADSTSKKGPPIRPSLNPALSLPFELMSKEPLGSEPLPDAAARGGRRSASPPVASVRLRPIRRSIASRSHLCPVACDPLASLSPCRHRRSRPPFRWQLSPANDRRPRYRLPSQSTRSREAKRMRRVQKIHADRAAERSCSRLGCAPPEVRLTTITISGAWVSTREMTPVNFSRCAGSIASFSAAKTGASRSLACLRASPSMIVV